jgi:Domain of unknown function (DUF5655)
MEWWTCPDCGRQFGRHKQGHVCVPAMSVNEYYADLPPFHREVHEAVVDHLQSEDDVHVETVSVGVLIKHGRTIVELRPMKNWLALSIVLPRRVRHPRITRTMPMNNGWAAHVVRIYSVDDIDDQVRDWLSESMHTI